MNDSTARLVDDYLERLDDELADLPRARRRELVQEIREHIEEGKSAGRADELEVRTLLDRLGDPADIAAEARERFDIRPRRGGGLEIAALVLLLAGGVLIPIVGWFIGLALLWASSVWTTRDKLIGTFVVPGGLAGPFALLFVAGGSDEECGETIDPVTGRVLESTCSGGPSTVEQILLIALVVVLFLAPIAATVYLARRMQRRSVSEPALDRAS